jgi:hypothetical protein
MSDINMIRPPRIGVAAEASAGHRITGPARKDAATAATNDARSQQSGQQRRAGQFGAPVGVQINRRGEAPVGKLMPQTVSVLTSTLGTVKRYCLAAGSKQGAGLVDQTLALIKAIADGADISDPPAPAPAPAQAPKQAAPPATPPNSSTPSSTPPASGAPATGSEHK